MKKNNIIRSVSLGLLAITPISVAASCSQSVSLHNVTLNESMFLVDAYSNSFTLKFQFEDKFQISDNYYSCPIAIFDKIVAIKEDEITEYQAKDVFSMEILGLENNSQTMELKMSVLPSAKSSKIPLGTTIYIPLKIDWISGSNIETAKVQWSRDFSSLVNYVKQIDDSAEKKNIRGQVGEVFIYNVELAEPIPQNAFLDVSSENSVLTPPPVTASVNIVHSYMPEDRKSIKLYIYDPYAFTSQQREWFNLDIKCKMQTGEKQATVLWSQSIKNIHIDYSEPKTELSDAGTQFPFGGKEYYTDITLTNPEITASGQVKANPEFWSNGSMVDNDFDSITFGPETFTQSGETKIRMNFSFKTKLTSPIRINPYIGVKFEVGNETFIEIYNLVFIGQ